jgi:hypothetical protein
MVCSIIIDDVEISDPIKGMEYFDYLSYCDL